MVVDQPAAVPSRRDAPVGRLKLGRSRPEQLNAVPPRSGHPAARQPAPGLRRAGWRGTAGLSALLAVLTATALRMVPLLTNRFHPDEALYAYFARLIASGHDPMLAGVVVDKPPAAFYLTALSLLAMGPNELAARLPEQRRGYYADLSRATTETIEPA